LVLNFFRAEPYSVGLPQKTSTRSNFPRILTQSHQWVFCVA